ncbi:hypothetical protein RCH18_002679 [Flavobacterium sp. PL11]|uniref:caspase family protein n=1 Tax=Flavobacterium sp. PL11 TaxID=3071717 RepID=UPI002DFB6B3E|nr:hypothetical protein [Flavobacterium sp. PL11]
MNYAIIIGIDHYEKKPLSAAVSDAKGFARYLFSKKLVSASAATIEKFRGEHTEINIDNALINNTADDNLQLLISESTNEIADNRDIDKVINNIIQDAKKHRAEKNRLYFYFAGHGIGVSYEKTALCLRLWPEWVNHCISSADYKSWFINKGVFDEILIFLDCCREYDQNIDAKSPMPDWETPIGDKKSPSILICNATMYGKLSYEVGVDKKRGAFTSFLMDSMNGDADLNNEGRITSDALKKHINKNFESYANKEGKIQIGDAYTQGTNGDDIIICELEKFNALHNCEITFTRDSNVTLLAIDATPLRIDNVKSGEKWDVNLQRGFSCIIDNVSNEVKLIENYSINTMTYVEF